ncbi:MAG TPA: glycosyltransferase 87 family protein [Streptosporangiaceae bacterium]|nr:glycosyltransferase 87 family protein [Streptosporangiaceae bacterium]
MSAVAAFKQAERPGTRTGLIVAAIAWVLTRVPMYLIDAGYVHFPFHSVVGGDTQIYDKWLPLLVSGQFPVRDPKWQYPPGAAALLSLPHLLPAGYADSFFIIELLCDLVITVLLVRMATRQGSWLGCWFWIVGLPLLGPFVLGDFDIAVTLLAVAALYLADSPWGLGAFGGLGAAVKVWPLVVLVGVRPGQAARAATAAVATAGVVIGGYLAFTYGSLSFLTHQDSRGLEIESVAAQPFLLLRLLGLWHGKIAFHDGCFQLVGPGVGVVAMVMVGCTVLALIALAYWRWRMSWRPEAVGDAALVAALLIIVTSRVISVQYMIWLIGIAACALAFPGTSQRPIARMLLISVGLTTLELLLLLRIVKGAGATSDIGVVILVARDALLSAMAILGFLRLWRSTRGPRRSSPIGKGAYRGAHAAGQGSASLAAHSRSALAKPRMRATGS